MNDTRQEIMRVAIDHFCAMEYPMVNLEEIARDAHVTRAPLYYYFKNKEGLYRAVVEATIAEARERVDAILGGEENVFEIIRKEYTYCVRGMGRYRRIWYPGPGAPDCQAQIGAFLQWLINRKTKLFKEAQQRGELSQDCDVSELVTLIYVFYDGVLDTQETAKHQTGFNHHLLEHSEDWFMQIIRMKFGNVNK